MASTGVITAKELAHYLNLPPRKVYRLLNMKGPRRLPGYRLEGRWLINLDRIQDWLLDRVEAGDGRARKLRGPKGDSN
jgi:excisionase family DNA binding protein